MKRSVSNKTRGAALVVILTLLPTMLMGGTCIVSHRYAQDEGKVVITQDVCGAKAPGALTIASYTAAVSEASPAEPILHSSHTPPTPEAVFTQAEPGETGKPPQSHLCA